MAANSKIEWTDASWNPIRARNRATGEVGWFCVHESPGCINCYAESMNNRLGTGVPFKKQYAPRVEHFLDEVMLTQPSRWKKPRTIFICSMTDLFGDWVPDSMIDEVIAEVARNPRHTFQIVTKRARRMREYFLNLPDRQTEMACTSALDFITLPLPNLWLMVSAEDQRRWDERVPYLIATPAAVRGVSVEPLIAMIQPLPETLACLDWIITGGESGPKARPAHPDWFRVFRDRCAEAGVPYFHKQNGEFDPITIESEEFIHPILRHHVGERVVHPNGILAGYAGPYKQVTVLRRVGKKVAGRTLDGQTHNARPPTALERMQEGTGA